MVPPWPSLVCPAAWLLLTEVGMGGRLTPPISLFPSVRHHQHCGPPQYLGDTPAAIAFEKAGILKPGVPAVIGETGREALPVIREQAALRKAPLHCLGPEYTCEAGGTAWNPVMTYRGFGREWTGLALGLAGAHQVHNAALAVSTALLLCDAFPRITEREIRMGLSSARWPGRLERVLDTPPVFMDAAHNPAGCRALARTLERCVLVFSVSADKDAAAMMDILAPIASPLILTTYQGGRALPIDRLLRQAGGRKVLSFPRMDEALEAGMRHACKEKPLLITGSIYGAGEARRILMERYGAARFLSIPRRPDPRNLPGNRSYPFVYVYLVV